MSGVPALTMRTARPGEAEKLYAIHRESVLTAYAHIFPVDRYPFPEDDMRAYWLEQLEDREATIVLAELDGVPTGFGVVAPGWLRHLFVLPGEWGRGTGSALHDRAVELMRAEGAGARLWVLEQNEQARAFYEHRGWRHDGTSEPSSYPPHPQVLRYALDLGAAAAGPIPSPHPPVGM